MSDEDQRVVNIALVLASRTLTPHLGWQRWEKHARAVVEFLTCDTAVDAAFDTAGCTREDARMALDAALLHEAQTRAPRVF